MAKIRVRHGPALVQQPEDALGQDVVFVAAGSVAIGFFRQMAAVMSELLHMAAAMGAALLTMIVIGVLAIVLFVHI